MRPGRESAAQADLQDGLAALLQQALRAPLDPSWVADGFVSENWLPVSPVSGKLDAFDALRACAGPDTTLILLTTSGLAHLPPIKVVTILAGAVHIGLGFFILSCIIARGARFFVLAWLLHRSPATLPIPGTSSRAHLDENLAAATLELTPADLAHLDPTLVA